MFKLGLNLVLFITKNNLVLILLCHFSRLEDAVDLKMVQTKVVTVTQTLVDGKVVSESKDVKSSEKLAVN